MNPLPTYSIDVSIISYGPRSKDTKSSRETLVKSFIVVSTSTVV